MAKGKKGKKKAEPTEKDPNAVGEVDKTFYELQIADLNRKLARLRELTSSLEEKKDELEKNITQLDEDRGDVITYLKRQLNEKQNEIQELSERLSALQEAKTNDEIKFEAKVKELEEEYRNMKETLNSEIKLISGKLNALEEFRIQRDELMKKYLDQEKQIEEQEIRHKRSLYETEKMFIMSKDTIKREMEKKILELSGDFQASNEIRIAATTQRVIRENITINNEMDKLMVIIETLTDENETLKNRNRELRQNAELFQEERNIALGKSSLQRGVIDQLRQKYNKHTIEIDKQNTEISELKVKKEALQLAEKQIVSLKYKIRVLEQNLHATRCKEYAAKHMLSNSEAKAQQLKGLLFEAIDAIEQALAVRYDTDPSMKYSARETLLYHLLQLLKEGKLQIVRCESDDTIESVAATYLKGDLGFVPKLPKPEEPPVLKFNRESQVGQSLTTIKVVPVSVVSESVVSVVEPSASEVSAEYMFREGEDEDIITSSSEEEEEKDVGLESSSEESMKDMKDHISELESLAQRIGGEATEEEWMEEEWMLDYEPMGEEELEIPPQHETTPDPDT